MKVSIVDRVYYSNGTNSREGIVSYLRQVRVLSKTPPMYLDTFPVITYSDLGIHSLLICDNNQSIL